MSEQIRLDKWLFFARFFKTRSLASKQVSSGAIRLNGERTIKPAATVQPGDELSFAQGNRIRIVRVIACGMRRGPAAEAQLLYEDMSPPVEQSSLDIARVGERPTKKDRRALDELRRGEA